MFNNVMPFLHALSSASSRNFIHQTNISLKKNHSTSRIFITELLILEFRRDIELFSSRQKF